MQFQISNIINRINKHNKRGYIYSFKVRHLEYVINYSFIRILRNLHNLCNLQRKPQVTRNFATLIILDMGLRPYCALKNSNVSLLSKLDKKGQTIIREI